MRARTIAAAIILSLTGCTATAPESDDPATPPTIDSSTAASPSASPSAARASATPAAPPTPPQPSRSPTRPPPVRFDAAEAVQDVRYLARDIGPREATSPNFARA